MTEKLDMKPDVVIPETDVFIPGRALFWPIKRWRALQQKRFAGHLAWAVRTRLNDRITKIVGQYPSTFSLADISLLPITTKHDLAVAGTDAFAVRSGLVAEWVATSGTTGKPLRVPLTHGDLLRLAENEAVALNIAGLQPGDTLFIAVAMDKLFVAGLAYWLGARLLEATSLRVGAHFFPQMETLASFAAPPARQFLITVPSLVARAAKIHQAASIKFQAVIGIGEPLLAEDLRPNALAECLAKNIGVPVSGVLGTYASTETCSTFAQGPQCRGGHLNPALAVVEILDEHNNPVPSGTVGQVVITPLGMQGMPLIRFATGDLAALYTDPCPCGRTTPRLGPILGRRGELLKVRGTSLFPATIYDLLDAFPGIADYLLVVRQEHELSDDITIHVQFASALADVPALCRTLEQQAVSQLKIMPEIVVSSAGDIAKLRAGRNARKPLKFLDMRPAV